ncbi:MAG: hypothetical protein ACI3V1_03535 [Faecousia sp.]
MAAMGGIVFLLILLLSGFVCIILAEIGLIGCKIYRKKTGKVAKLFIRIILWIVLIAGIAITAIPAMYFYLILSNWNWH